MSSVVGVVLLLALVLFLAGRNREAQAIGGLLGVAFLVVFGWAIVLGALLALVIWGLCWLTP